MGSRAEMLLLGAGRGGGLIRMGEAVSRAQQGCGVLNPLFIEQLRVFGACDSLQTLPCLAVSEMPLKMVLTLVAGEK